MNYGKLQQSQRHLAIIFVQKCNNVNRAVWDAITSKDLLKEDLTNFIGSP